MNFKELAELNVNEHKEKKNGFSYLSWAWAWKYFKENYPDATYKVYRNENGFPYFKEDGVGAFAMTSITANGETLEMWLPAMDYKNQALTMPTATQLNKTIMRCLVKNMAMFGLGLYLYAGEDLPSETEDVDIASQPIPKHLVKVLEQMLIDTKVDKQLFLDWLEVEDLKDITNAQYKVAYNTLESKLPEGLK